MSLYPYKPEENKVAGGISRNRKYLSRNIGSEKNIFRIAECNSKKLNSNIEKKKCFSSRGSIIKYDFKVFSRSQRAFKMFLPFMTLYPYKPEVSKDVERIGRNLGTEI